MSRSLAARAQALLLKNERTEVLSADQVEIFESLEAGVWISGLDGVTLFVNSSLSLMMGYKPEEMIGKLATSFVDDEGRKLASANRKERLAGKSDSYMFRFQHKLGSGFWATVAANPLRGNNGDVIAFMGIITPCKDAPSRLSQQVLTCANLSLDPATLEYSIGNRRGRMSAFCFKLLEYFVMNQGKVVSRQELMKHVWGNPGDLTDRVIDARVATLRKALTGFRGSFRTIYSFGYQLLPQENLLADGDADSKLVPRSPPESGPNEKESLQGLKVLLVEDDLAFREGLAALLTRAGAAVICAEDGEKALSALVRNRVDVLLTDLEMPNMGGLELLTHLDRLKIAPLVLLVATGSLDAPTDKLRALGVRKIFAKPFRATELLDELFPLVAKTAAKAGGSESIVDESV